MSSQELVDAYVHGRMSRRALIRRLIAGGVSLGAAVSYAHLLDPERAAARAFGDIYPEPLSVTGKILDQDLDRVIETGKLKVRFSIPAAAEQVEFRVWVRRPRHTFTYSLIGERTIFADGPLTRKAAVPLAVNPPHSVDALRPLQRAKLDLSTVARGNGRWGSDFDQRTLRR